MTIPFDQLPPAARRKALEQHGRKRAPRRAGFSKDRARTFAIRMLAAAAELSPSQRGRVLQIALRMNRV
jgi:hypothetical protein